MCETRSETIEHFMNCESYQNITPENNWKVMFGEITDKQFEIAEKVRKKKKKYITMRLVIFNILLTPGLHETVEQCDIL